MTDSTYRERITRGVAVASICLALTTTAAAVPLGPSSVRVEDLGAGRILVDLFHVFGSRAAGDWDPLLLASVGGRIEDVLVFGTSTADPGDDFTRYWVSTHRTGGTQRWVMPPSASLIAGAPSDSVPVPEPRSLLLFGSGLLAIAATTRRLWRR